VTIEIVINTHLHWDHCSIIPFPPSEVLRPAGRTGLCQRPLAGPPPAYEKAPGLAPAWLDVWGRIELVDGDAEIAPGSAWYN